VDIIILICFEVTTAPVSLNLVHGDKSTIFEGGDLKKAESGFHMRDFSGARIMFMVGCFTLR
jgi:hypothetical protein